MPERCTIFGNVPKCISCCNCTWWDFTKCCHRRITREHSHCDVLVSSGMEDDMNILSLSCKIVVISFILCPFKVENFPWMELIAMRQHHLPLIAHMTNECDVSTRTNNNKIRKWNKIQDEMIRDQLGIIQCRFSKKSSKHPSKNHQQKLLIITSCKPYPGSTEWRSVCICFKP